MPAECWTSWTSVCQGQQAAWNFRYVFNTTKRPNSGPNVFAAQVRYNFASCIQLAWQSCIYSSVHVGLLSSLRWLLDCNSRSSLKIQSDMCTDMCIYICTYMYVCTCCICLNNQGSKNWIETKTASSTVQNRKQKESWAPDASRVVGLIKRIGELI